MRTNRIGMAGADADSLALGEGHLDWAMLSRVAVRRANLKNRKA